VNVAFEPVSTMVNKTSSFSEVVLDEEENLPVHKNTSLSFVNDTNKLDTKIGEEPVSPSLPLESEEIQTPTHSDEIFDKMKPADKDYEKQKSQQVHSASSESDEEKPKPRVDDHFRREEHANEGEDGVGEKYEDDDDNDDN
jgi:hypothetical protein